MKKILIIYLFLVGCVLSVTAQTDVIYESLYDNNNFTQAIDVSLSAGATVGDVSVTPSGAATYNIPISIPPGTHGMVPQLSVGYNSQGGNGLLGMGWNLSGLSAISRSGKSIAYDNQVSPVKLTNEDFFNLDGNRLVVTSGANGAAASTYATKMETFSKVTAYGNIGGCPEYFIVEMKNGMIYEYGNSIDSRFTSLGATVIWSWQLNKVRDQYGNYVEYIYETIRTGSLVSVVNDELPNYEIRIKEIKYTGNSNSNLLPYNKIAFTYGVRKDKNVALFAGESLGFRSLLTKVVVTTEDNKPVRTYDFTYGLKNEKSYLKRVKETGSDGIAMNPTIFKYGESTPTIALDVQDVFKNLKADYFTGDFNGDGFTDVMAAFRKQIDNVTYYTGFKIYCAKPNPIDLSKTVFEPKYSKTFEDNLFVSLQSERIRDWWVAVTGQGPGFTVGGIPTTYNLSANVAPVGNDFNGDGRSDLIFLYRKRRPTSGFEVFKMEILQPNATAESFETVNCPLPTGSLQLDLSDNNFFTGDFDGDGKSDYILNTFSDMRISYPFKGIYNKYILEGNQIFDNGRFRTVIKTNVIDFDGDGKRELLLQYLQTDDTNVPYRNKIEIFGFNFDGYDVNVKKISSMPSFPIDDYGDFNGDNKIDLVNKIDITNQNIAIRYLTGTSFTLPINSNINGNNYILGGRRLVGDFNGDGLSDLVYLRKKDNTDKVFLTLYINTGNSKFVPQPDFELLYPLGLDSDNILVGDFNGDGIDEILDMERDKDEEFQTNNTRHITFYAKTQERLLTGVMNGMKVESTIEYGLATYDNNLYKKTGVSGHPLNYVTPATNLVKAIEMPNGNTSGVGALKSRMEYLYEDLMVNRAGFGSLGFKKVTTFDRTNETQSTTEFEVLTYPFVNFNRENGLLKTISTKPDVNKPEQFSVTMDYWDENRLVKTLTDVNGFKTNTEYDDFLRPKLVKSSYNTQNSTYAATSVYDYINGTNFDKYVGLKTTYSDNPNFPEINKQYIDGLGRPITYVKEGYTPSGNHQKTYFNYDALGRAGKSYEPFHSNVLGFEAVPTGIPFSYNEYDQSPLSRPKKIYDEINKFTEAKYETNVACEVRKFKFDGTIDGFYELSSLYKNIVIDRNGNKAESFADKLGRNILTRKYVTDPFNSELKKVDTYNLYNEYGNIIKVIPPGALVESQPNNSCGSSASLTESLCFSYVYDAKQRLIRKKVPSADWVNIFYDDRNLVILTQDGNMRELNPRKHLGRKYDKLGRTLQKGVIYIPNASDAENFAKTDFVLDSVYTEAKFEEGKSRLTQSKARVLGNRGGNETEWITTDFVYDAYGNVQSELSNNIWGKPENNTYTYNNAGQVLEANYKNTDFWNQDRGFKSTNVYDDRGQRLKKVFHQVNPWWGFTPNVQVAEYNYNHLDQLVEKNIGWNSNNNKFLQSVDYAYNSRGWLTSINNSFGTFNPNAAVNRVTDNQYAVSTTKGTFAPVRTYNESNIDLFSQDMSYDFPLNAGVATPQYNGNISEITWRIADKPQQDYIYKYDEINRLKEAKYSDVTASGGLPSGFSEDNKYGEKVTYDLRGNITSVVRRGMTQPCLDPNGFVCGEFGIIDNLGYNYNHSTKPNQLLGVSEGANMNEGFKFKGDGLTDYKYDKNGNLVADKNKGITYIEYNYMNLPVRIYFEGNGNYIDFVYDATGFKHKKEVIKSWSPITDVRIHYCQGLEYISYNLDKMYHPEGYVKIEPYNGVGVYNYVLKDHLGNGRVTFSDENNDGIVAYSDVKQVNNYYPFGMNMKGAWNGQKGQNKIQFNDQEFIGNFNNFDIDLYDYTYRYYDAAIARFTSVDALAHSYTHYAPYQFAGNEVPNAIDVDGLEPARVFTGPSDFSNLIDAFTVTATKTGPTSGKFVIKNIAIQQIYDKLDQGRQNIRQSINEAVKTFPEFVAGVTNSIAANLTWELPGVRQEANTDVFASGQKLGDILSIFIGSLEVGSGAEVGVGALLLAPETGGASLVAVPVATGVIVHGNGVIFSAANSLLNPSVVKAKKEKNFGYDSASNQTPTEPTIDSQIPASLKRSKSYDAKTAQLPLSEVRANAAKGDKKAKDILKLFEEQNRLLEKVKTSKKQ